MRPGMGPTARRLLRSMRDERRARDQAREAAQRKRRVGIVQVQTPGDDPDLATKVARALEANLRGRGFSVRPFRKIHQRVEAWGKELLGSNLSLRQLARRLGLGHLIQVKVLEFRVANGNHAGFAIPSWWTEAERKQEFVEVHLKLEIFDALEGKVVARRQDRQHRFVPPTLDEEPSLRSQTMEQTLQETLDHLLFDWIPESPADAFGPGYTGRSTQETPGG